MGSDQVLHESGGRDQEWFLKEPLSWFLLALARIRPILGVASGVVLRERNPPTGLKTPRWHGPRKGSMCDEAKAESNKRSSANCPPCLMLDAADSCLRPPGAWH